MPPRRYAAAMRSACLVATLGILSGCSTWFFSGSQWIDRGRPVALVETTGGIECAATTEFGVLTLGRTASSGPCRVRYLLGPTPMVESGELRAAGGGFTRADIDLKTQSLRALDRSPTPADRLRVMWTMDGQTTQAVAVRLAQADGVQGDVLADPGVELPAGATVLCEKDDDDGWLFAGLVAGRAVRRGTDGEQRFYVFAGVDRIREMLAVPIAHPVDLQPKYRADDVVVMKPVPPAPATTPTVPATSLQQLLEQARKAKAGQPTPPPAEQPRQPPR